MHGVQPAALESGPHAPGAQPELDELLERYDSMLPPRQPRDRRIDRGVC